MARGRFGLVLFATALSMVPAAAGAQNDALGRLMVWDPARGPRVVLRPLDEPPLVVLRLSVPIDESAEPSGAAWVLQELVRERFEAAAADLGARAELRRSPGHAVYMVTGAAEDFAALVDLLRRATERPRLDPGEIRAAAARADRQALAALELPAVRVRRDLQSKLFPTHPPSGERIRLDALTPDRLDRFWRAHFIPERMNVVVVGPVDRAEVGEAFRGWPRPERGSRRSSGRAAAATEPPPAAQAIAEWAGIGWTAELDPAVLAVGAVLIAGRLAAAPLRRADSELWWGRERVALVAIGSAPAKGEGAAVATAQALRMAVAAVATDATPDDVARARRALRGRLFSAARTPGGLAEMIGEFDDRTGDPWAAGRFLAMLSDVDALRVRFALRRLLERSPAVVEVKP